ncbi:hypothetical protein NDU88_003930 [Pleurodeles waltl]|uniref:Uncharacterized protein n=1 Tax=Pleurodeles waltl TaxID=8319 RepID=A0AAV7KWY0_PLEWA|nr:hypothetical protein NDU88_003930 [Pleurodeles waltl]
MKSEGIAARPGGRDTDSGPGAAAPGAGESSTAAHRSPDRDPESSTLNRTKEQDERQRRMPWLLVHDRGSTQRGEQGPGGVCGLGMKSHCSSLFGAETRVRTVAKTDIRKQAQSTFKSSPKLAQTLPIEARCQPSLHNSRKNVSRVWGWF